MLGEDQRRVAYGVVSVLCLAWAARGVAGIVTAYATPVGMDGTGGYLFLVAVVGAGLVLAAFMALVAGIRAIRRVDAGGGRWRTCRLVTGEGSLASACTAVLTLQAVPVVGVLLACQACALLALAVMLRRVPGQKT